MQTHTDTAQRHSPCMVALTIGMVAQAGGGAYGQGASGNIGVASADGTN